jgi:hypothetical protein
MRSQTEPVMGANSLTTIQEATARIYAPPRDHSRRHTPNPSPPTRTASPAPQKRSPSTQPQPPSSRDRLSGSYRNPLPAPPVDVHNPVTSAPLPTRPPPGTWNRRVRRGFWNKRGDFLTRDGQIVYAPDHRAYPEELKDYPDKDYRNELGDVAPFLERPELPGSLPLRGHPPVQPYEMVSVLNSYQALSLRS